MIVSPIGLTSGYVKINAVDKNVEKDPTINAKGNADAEFAVPHAETLAAQKGIKINFKGSQDKGREDIRRIEAKMKTLGIKTQGHFLNEFMNFNQKKIDALYTYLEDIGEEITYFTKPDEKARILNNPEPVSVMTPDFIDKLAEKYKYEDRGISWWTLADLQYNDMFKSAGYIAKDEDMDDFSALAMACKDFAPDKIDACKRIVDAIGKYRGVVNEKFPKEFIGRTLLWEEEGQVSAAKVRAALRLIENEPRMPLEEVSQRVGTINPRKLGLNKEDDVLKPLR